MGIFFDQPRHTTRVVTRVADANETELAATLQRVMRSDNFASLEGTQAARVLAAQHAQVMRDDNATTQITTETKDNSEPTWWKVGGAIAVLGIVFLGAYALDGTSHEKTRDALLTVFQGGFVGLLALLGLESR